MRLSDLFISKLSGEWGTDPTDLYAIPVIRTTNFAEYGMINYANLVYRGITPKKVEEKHLKDGDILLEKSGGTDKKPVGRVVYFEAFDSAKYLCNNFVVILRPNKEFVVPRYAFYLMLSLYLNGVTVAYQNKTTGIQNLHVKAYLNKCIKLPSIVFQRKIVSQLNQIVNLILRRKQQLAKLDELAKSPNFSFIADCSSPTKLRINTAKFSVSVVFS